jgi:hypothetical protein
MNASHVQTRQLQKPVSANGSQPQPPVSIDKEKQNFLAAIQPIVYRARQHGLNRVQIREIITSLL